MRSGGGGREGPDHVGPGRPQSAPEFHWKYDWESLEDLARGSQDKIDIEKGLLAIV